MLRILYLFFEILLGSEQLHIFNFYYVTSVCTPSEDKMHPASDDTCRPETNYASPLQIRIIHATPYRQRPMTDRRQNRP